MAITRVKPDWAFADKLSSDELDGIENNTTYALDKRSGQTDTLGSVVSASGAGRLVATSLVGANANTTYYVTDAAVIRVTSSLSANRTYSLHESNAVAGDIITVTYESGSFRVLVKELVDTEEMISVGPDDGQSETRSASFRFDGVRWRLLSGARAKQYSQTFTSSGTWTCPRGVTSVDVFGYGGGGSGGGGANGTTSTANITVPGAGGGGALLSRQTVTVVPGTTYTVTIGAGGSGVLAQTHGNNGQSTTFGSLATFLGGGGGSAGEFTVPTSGDEFVSVPGPSVSLYDTAYLRAVANYQVSISPGAGGGGRANAAEPSYSGMGQQQGFAGGAGGTFGSSGGSYNGGPGGGGGGAGPGGVGGAGGVGGNGNNAGAGTAGSAGSAAAANTGAGGGGGGGGGQGSSGSSNGGSGGAGGSGRLTVTWIK